MRIKLTGVPADMFDSTCLKGSEGGFDLQPLCVGKAAEQLIASANGAQSPAVAKLKLKLTATTTKAALPAALLDCVATADGDSVDELTVTVTSPVARALDGAWTTYLDRSGKWSNLPIPLRADASELAGGPVLVAGPNVLSVYTASPCTYDVRFDPDNNRVVVKDLKWKVQIQTNKCLQPYGEFLEVKANCIELNKALEPSIVTPLQVKLAAPLTPSSLAPEVQGCERKLEAGNVSDISLKINARVQRVKTVISADQKHEFASRNAGDKWKHYLKGESWVIFRRSRSTSRSSRSSATTALERIEGSSMRSAASSHPGAVRLSSRTQVFAVHGFVRSKTLDGTGLGLFVTGSSTLTRRMGVGA